MKSFLIFSALYLGCSSANAQIIFYDDCNLSSPVSTVYISQPDGFFFGSSTHIFNNSNLVSSLSIPGDYDFTVTLYGNNSASSNPNLDFRDYTKTTACLAGDFDNVAKSLRYVKNATGVNVATFYSGYDYNGFQNSGRYELPVGMYTTADLITRGIPLNEISSLTVRPGYYVKLKGDATHGGERTYKKSRANLIVDYFDNATTAIEIGTVGSNGTLIQPISGSVNVAGKLNNDEINIYPNPAKDYITISNLQGRNHISIFNAVGQQVSTTSSSGAIVTVDISTLARGYYQVEVMEVTGHAKSVSKIVKN